MPCFFVLLWPYSPVILLRYSLGDMSSYFLNTWEKWEKLVYPSSKATMPTGMPECSSMSLAAASFVSASFSTSSALKPSASAISITGTDIPVPASSQALLGPTVPNAAYGMPSTNKLKKGVYTAMKKNPKSTSVLMRHHGAVCLGKDYEEAFAVASALEKLSGEVIRTACGGNDLISAYLAKNDLPKVDDIFDLGSSSRNGDTFTLTMKDGSSYTCSVESGTAVIGTGIAPRVSRLHAAIYQANDIQYIKHDTNPYVVALSENGSTEKPFLDDFTQIAGIDVKNVSYDETERRTQNEAVASAMKGRNAKKASSTHWQTDQIVWWKDIAIDRQSEDFQQLIRHAYQAMFDQSERFRAALRRHGARGSTTPMARATRPRPS